MTVSPHPIPSSVSPKAACGRDEYVLMGFTHTHTQSLHIDVPAHPKSSFIERFQISSSALLNVIGHIGALYQVNRDENFPCFTSEESEIQRRTLTC